MNLMESEPYLRAKRKVARLRKPSKGYDNETAFSILVAHYIQGAPVAVLEQEYLNPGQDPTCINKLLAKNEGKESSRRVDVRRIFFEMVKELGIEINVNRTEREGIRSSGRNVRTNWGSAKPILGADNRTSKDKASGSAQKES